MTEPAASLSLSGKRALVTGAATRVGRSIALELARAGADVALHYHSREDEAERTLADLRSMGRDGVRLQADFRDRAATRDLVDRAIAHFGGLDILVPSAANFERVAFDALDDDHWDRALDVDLSAPALLAHRATPALRTSQGSIVFITCSSTITPFKNHLPYVVAKAGVKQLMRTLALELAPDVRVNAVAPGTVLPPSDMRADGVERLSEKIPLGRIGSADDVARAVLYLCTADFVTGHELVVDGGRSVAATERFS